MSPDRLVIIGVVGLAASGIGAITGGNSLITVPTLLLLGMDVKTAIATNMLAITCQNAAAAGRFLRERSLVPRHPTTGLVLGAIPSALVGAYVALEMPPEILKAIISAAMLGMAIFLALAPRFGAERRETSRARNLAGYALLAVWGVYGGLFSGGYTTVLTFGCVALFGVTLVESVALTKVVNFASSIAATILFALEGKIDFTVGAVMSVAMASGGYLGAHYALRAGTTRVRWVFVLVVGALGVKLLVDALS